MAGVQISSERILSKKEIAPHPAVCWCFSSLQPTPHPHLTGFLIIGNVMTNQGMTYKSLCFSFHYVCAYQDRFQRGLWLPWHTPPWQKFGRANAFKTSKVMSFSARSVVHNNLSILSRPGKAFPRERKWLCEYHSAWPSLGTLKYSLFWRWNFFKVM